VPIFVDLRAPIFNGFFGVSSTLLAKALPDGAPRVDSLEGAGRRNICSWQRTDMAQQARQD
jgi:hypothetical protein